MRELDARLERLRSEPGRTWGARDALLAVLAVPASLGLALLVLGVLPEVPAAAGVGLATLLLAGATALAVRRPAEQSGGVERALGFDLPLWSDAVRMVRWSLGLLLVQGLAVLALQAAVPALRDASVENADFLRDVPPATLVGLVLAAVLVAPVVEELLFRGVVLQGLMLRTGFWPAALVSSAVFGAFHATVAGVDAIPIVLATGVFGLGLCLLARRTGRLGPGIGVHALRNAVAVAAVALGG